MTTVSTLLLKDDLETLSVLYSLAEHRGHCPQMNVRKRIHTSEYFMSICSLM
jgi:hypothetical protein